MGLVKLNTRFSINKRTADTIGWITGILTLLLLFSTPPTLSPNEPGLWLVIIGLTGLFINFGLSFTEGEINAAQSVGLMGFLLLANEDNFSEPLWVVALGVLFGIAFREAPRYDLNDWRRFALDVWLAASRTIGQLVLSLAMGGWFYRQLGGETPLQAFDVAEITPILGFIAVQMAVYLTLSVVYVRSRQGEQLGRQMLLNWQSLIGVLLLPMPIAVTAAVVYRTTSPLAFASLSLGLFITVMSIYGLSRSQNRYEHQVKDLQTLATISNAMRTNLNMKGLLEALYLQVASLLKVEDFTIALYDPDRNYINFPIHRRDGKHIQLSPIPYVGDLPAGKITQRVSHFILEQVYDLRIVPRDYSMDAWLGVPILTSEQTVGAMIVVSKNGEREFTAQDKQLLSTIAAQSGVALDNAQLYEQANHRAEKLRTLTRMSAELSATLNPELVFKRTLESACEVVEANASAFFTFSKDRGNVQIERAYNLSDAFVKNPVHPMLLKSYDFENRQLPYIVIDTNTDERVESIRDDFYEENITSFIEITLRNAGEILGILVVYYQESRWQSDEDIEILLTFASQAALTIANAQLYSNKDEALSRRVSQLTLLESLGQELFSSRIQLQDIYAQVLRRAAEGTGAQVGLLALNNPTESSSEIVATYGDIPQYLLEDGSLVERTQYAMYHADTKLISDIEHNPRFPTIHPATRSVLSVPILQGMNVSGVITLESHKANAFGNEDMIFIMQVGAQIRIANDNLNLIRSIEENRDRLQTILDSMTEGIILIGDDGLIQLANPQVKDLLDLDFEDLDTVSLPDLMQNDTQVAAKLGFEHDVLHQKMQQLTSGTWRATNMLYRANYSLQFGSQATAVTRTDVVVSDKNEDVIGWLMVFKDVTEERELEQAREDLYSMIVHDLRGPLTAIKASLSIIHKLADGEMKPMIQQTTDTGSRAVNKLLNLINSLLDISKMQNGTMALDREPSNIQSVADQVLEGLSPLAQEMEVNLSNNLADTLPFLNIDSEKIERVLTNLVDNAIKFTPGKGNVIIDANPRLIHKGENSDQKFLEIQVIDTGPGIPDDYKEKLFDRYVQVKGQKGRRKGTGLGLTFCMLAVEAHQGKIWVDDNPHGGSIFSFTLPIFEP